MTEIDQHIATRRKAWQVSLAKIQAKPLTYCPAFPETAQRWNDWWKSKNDRPLIVAQVAKTQGIRWDKAFDLLDQPEEWVRVRRTQVEQTHFAGEALPSARVDIGPVATAAFMGAPLHFASAEQTSWQDPIIESWEETARLEVAPKNPWLEKVLRLLDRLAEDARGQYLVCLPDLTGAMDAVANMRGTQRLCFDLYEHRDAVLAATFQAVNAWETVFSRMYDLVLGYGTGLTQWVSCWADSPFTVPTCDFNALIGPQDFVDTCLPSLSEQARRAGLCVFHLDGPDAARHAEALAQAPEITAVQYTPGAGTPSAVAVLPMLRMFQQHKVPLFIDCPLDEVQQVAQELDPAGVAIRTSGFATPQEADALVAWRDKTFC